MLKSKSSRPIRLPSPQVVQHRGAFYFYGLILSPVSLPDVQTRTQLLLPLPPVKPVERLYNSSINLQPVRFIQCSRRQVLHLPETGRTDFQ